MVRPGACIPHRPLRFPLRRWFLTSLKGLVGQEPSLDHSRMSDAYLSAGVKDRRLRARWENSSGRPDRQALPLRQLDRLWQDQGLLPGAVPRQRQLGARKGHRQLLDNRDSQEGGMDVGEKTTNHCLHTQPRVTTFYFRSLFQKN